MADYLKEFTKRDFQLGLLIASLVFIASHFISKSVKENLG